MVSNTSVDGGIKLCSEIKRQYGQHISMASKVVSVLTFDDISTTISQTDKRCERYLERPTWS